MRAFLGPRGVIKPSAMTNTNSKQTPIALITGASRGLGKSMAVHLADRGVDVVITYKTGEREAREVALAIEKKGRKAALLALDVADSKSFGAFAEALKSALRTTWDRDRFDYLVNNAGSGVHASVTET